MSIAELPTSEQASSSPFSEIRVDSLHRKSLDDLDAINFYCFGGRRDFSNNFRALVVGGETGQSAIDLACQLRGIGATVVFVDSSESNVDAAQQHADTLGLRNEIEWTQADPLELGATGMPPFDYVNCCGLLETDAELASVVKSLKSLLKLEGALGLSVHGKYGQTGISQMRDLMQIVNHGIQKPEVAVSNARLVIDRLPATNWCKRAVDLYPLYERLSDAEVYDLFVETQPLVYSLPEVWETLSANGLLLVEHTREQRALYEPQFAFPAGPLLTQIQLLPRREQQAATELYWGAAQRHTLWASNRPDTVAPLTDPDMIPFFTRFAIEQDVQQSILGTTSDEWSWTTRLAGEVDVSITFHIAPAARRFVELIDNKRTLAEIIEAILSAYNPRPPIEEAMKISRYVMEVLLRQDLLMVRHKSTVALPKAA